MPAPKKPSNSAPAAPGVGSKGSVAVGSGGKGPAVVTPAGNPQPKPKGLKKQAPKKY